jgi:poly-gamma-glutamate capsule biosynthesis protein CapA/YwtB (metallophosphatase superfamily)
MLAFACLVAVSAALASAQGANETSENPSDPGVKDSKLFDPKRPPDLLFSGRVVDGFTLAAVGDCIIRRPLSQDAARDPSFAAVVKLLRGADATYGNMEISIVDLAQSRFAPNPGPDDWSMAAAPAVAKDLKSMGFRVLSRANNHALDWGADGMRETSRWLDEAGLVYAGAGIDAGNARAARYYESSKGRVAIVSMASTFTPNTEALAPHGAAPGRPGISALHVKKYSVVPAAAMEQLHRLHGTLYPDEPAPSSGSLTMLGGTFESGQAYSFRYEMDPVDLSAIMKNIRQGRQNADFLLATIHSHEPDRSSAADPQTDMLDTPARFLQELAHSAIDTGADAFITTGIHHLGPIEVYHGRPIFYGMGNFFWGETDEWLTSDVFQQYRETNDLAFKHPERATDTDVSIQQTYPYFAGDIVYQSVVAVAQFRQGQLSELRLYPIDLGYGRPLTASGTPRMAGPDQGRSILERLKKISSPYGTQIVIENNVGIIRPPIH